VTFGSHSKLTDIESGAFFLCKALKSITIPSSIRSLQRNWYENSSFDRVIFETGESLLAMIECGESDLNFNFDLYVCEWDGVLSFPGYCVSIIPDQANFVQLVKVKENVKNERS
jgi:hypothetical protein